MFRKRNIFERLFKFEGDAGAGGGSFMSGGEAEGAAAAGGEGTAGAGNEAAGNEAAGSQAAAGVTFVDSQGNFATGWRDQLPEGIRGAASLESIKDINGLAAAYVSTKSMVGADTIKLPGENSSADDWNAFYKQTGRPETAEEYTVTRNADIPENLQNSKYIDDFKATFHELGLNQKQVDGIMTKYDGQMLELMQEQSANAVDPVEARDTALKTEWGNDFKMNMSKADMAAKQLDPTGAIFNGVAATDPAFIQAMAKVADLIGGDSIVSGNSDPAGLDGIESELSTIRSSDAYQNENHADHERTVAKHNILAQKRAALRK